MKITPINPKYQAAVNKFVRQALKYDKIVAEHFRVEGELTASQQNKEEKAYEDARNSFDDLPKRERQNIDKCAKMYFGIEDFTFGFTL